MTHDPAKNARLAAYLATPEGKAAFAALAAHGDVVARAAQALRDGENEAALRLLEPVLTPEQFEALQRQLFRA